MADGLEQIGSARRHAPKGIPGAHLGNGALVAVHTAIMAHLEEERPVAKTVAAFHAFGAANAQLLVDGVFVIGILHIRPLDRSGRTEAVLRSGIEIVRLGLKIASAQLAIPAKGISVHTFDGGLFQHAVCRAVTAADALLRVDLPDCALRRTAAGHQANQAAQAGQGGHSRTIAQKSSASNGNFGLGSVLAHGSNVLHDPNISGHQIEDVDLA
jgi:hypothetical protein